MHGNLFTQRHLTGIKSPGERISLWPMMVLVIGGAVTLAWIGVLLWAAFRGASWVFNAIQRALGVVPYGGP